MARCRKRAVAGEHPAENLAAGYIGHAVAMDAVTGCLIEAGFELGNHGEVTLRRVTAHGAEMYEATLRVTAADGAALDRGAAAFGRTPWEATAALGRAVRVTLGSRLAAYGGPGATATAAAARVPRGELAELCALFDEALAPLARRLHADALAGADEMLTTLRDVPGIATITDEMRARVRARFARALTAIFVDPTKE